MPLVTNLTLTPDEKRVSGGKKMRNVSYIQSLTAARNSWLLTTVSSDLQRRDVILSVSNVTGQDSLAEEDRPEDVQGD